MEWKIWKERSALISKSQFNICSMGAEISLLFWAFGAWVRKVSPFICMGGEEISLLFWAFWTLRQKVFPFSPFIWMAASEAPFILYSQLLTVTKRTLLDATTHTCEQKIQIYMTVSSHILAVRTVGQVQWLIGQVQYNTYSSHEQAGKKS